MFDVERVLRIHHDTVVRWHQEPIDQSFESIYGLVCEQHSYNFQLWHQEDMARSPSASDTVIAGVKRRIDKLNQQRNDWIEKIDDWIAVDLPQTASCLANCSQNTETPGSAVDRLSILALRLYHLDEQSKRKDADPSLLSGVHHKIAVGLEQQRDLARSLTELVDDIYTGRKRHTTYRQMKMYNDPNLNPQIYQAEQRRAG